ncbi:glycosyltransferase family 2 protein [Flavobacterium sp.]|uniref:glycosyltransferase family 2 protein n=1 Tax=Flavobacterium sp. TaxID=239 RepID=UPI00263411D5|nr:glycosyltransferase family 2 protein [Flavobacterium sp.]
MKSISATFTILITTKDRIEDLKFTLVKIQHVLERNDVECIVCDDGSTDETSSFLQLNYPTIQLIRNAKSKGLIYSRNALLSLVTTPFAISIDDDLHFITPQPLELIANHFERNENCGLIGFRIFWDVKEPISTVSKEIPVRMQSFAGGAHVWRMSAWNAIPNYPAWFVFYGEEDFASYHLFKKSWEIHYLPEVLVHHRVDIKARKIHADYGLRLRRSLRSGWYLYFLFYPLQSIPRKMGYSLWMQFKLKVFKGDWKALQAIVLALFDVVKAIPKIIKSSNRLTKSEYQVYQKLEATKLYWKPKNEVDE